MLTNVTGTTGHEKETEDNRENDEPASDENILDRSFDVDDVKMSEEDNAEEHVDEHSDQKKDDSFLDDEKRALIEVEVEKEIRRGIRSSDPQESASDDDASSGSEDSDDESSASSSDSQYTSSEDESPDSAKNSPPPKKSASKERHAARTERPGSNLKKRRRASSRSASPLSRSQQGSLRVVVNNERGRRVHQSNNDYHGAMEGAKKSKRLCADSSAVNNVLKDAKFFLIKSANMENILISQSLNVWATTKFNDKMLSDNFHRVRNIILIFSVEKSGAFQGFARLRSASQRDHKTVNWVLPPNFPANRLGGIFRLKWITRQELPFTSAAHLHNPLNEDKPIKVGRDGTEIQGLVARRLCGMFPLDANIDLTNMGEASGRGTTSSTVTSSIRDRRRSSPLHSSSAKMKSRHERSRSKEDRRKGSRHDRPEYRSRDRKIASNGRPLHASGDIPPLSSVVSVPRRPRESYPPM
uniref:YTH domain-containing protein n=1 Tax=Plectus sambesii TaxID=2011161 RepID=A0A914XPR5_9BILA